MTRTEIGIIKEVGVIEFMESEISRLNDLVEITKGQDTDDITKDRVIRNYEYQIWDFGMRKDIKIESLKNFHDYDYKAGVANA